MKKFRFCRNIVGRLANECAIEDERWGEMDSFISYYYHKREFKKSTCSICPSWVSRNLHIANDKCALEKS